MSEPFICYDCMSVTNGDCGRHGPRIVAVWETTQPIAEPIPEAPSPAEEPRPCGRIFAPWTRAQVAALNDYQESGAFHPFTCGNRDTRPHHDYAAANNAPDHGILVATLNGWTCPSCDYTQDWAHNFMADRHSWTRTPAPSDPPQPERKIRDHTYVQGTWIKAGPAICCYAIPGGNPHAICGLPRSAHSGPGEGGRP